MQGDSWETAGRRLIETWLASLGPFGPAATSPGSETADPLLHLRQFADVLAQAVARQQVALDPSGDLHGAVVNLFDDLSAQISVLKRTLIDAPPMDWGAAWGQSSHPILGPWREIHGRSQRMLEAMNAVTEAGRCLQRMHLEVLARALDTCRAKLREPDGSTITSLRDLFDWWVAVVDAAYRDAAFTDDYAKAFGQAVNAASELKLAVQALDTLWPGAAMTLGAFTDPRGVASAPAPAPAPSSSTKRDAPASVPSEPQTVTQKPAAPHRRRRTAPSPAPAHIHPPESAAVATLKTNAGTSPPRVKKPKPKTSTPDPRGKGQPAPKQSKSGQSRVAAKTGPVAPRTRRDEFDIGHIAPTRK